MMRHGRRKLWKPCSWIRLLTFGMWFILPSRISWSSLRNNTWSKRNTKDCARARVQVNEAVKQQMLRLTNRKCNKNVSECNYGLEVIGIRQGTESPQFAASYEYYNVRFAGDCRNKCDTAKHRQHNNYWHRLHSLRNSRLWCQRFQYDWVYAIFD